MCWLRHNWKYHVHPTQVHRPPACKEYLVFRTCHACGQQQIYDFDSRHPWQGVEPPYRVPVAKWWREGK